MTNSSLSLEFQLTFDEYAEATAASRSIKPTKGKAKTQHRVWLGDSLRYFNQLDCHYRPSRNRWAVG